MQQIKYPEVPRSLVSKKLSFYAPHRNKRKISKLFWRLKTLIITAAI